VSKVGVCQVLSLVPGRVRLQLSEEARENATLVEDRLRWINGVQSVQANPLTQNVLVHFDRRTITADTLPEKLNRIWEGMPHDKRPALAGLSSTPQEKNARCSPVRVVVRGLLGHAVVDSLWFGAGFLDSAVGLPLSGLGPLHLLMDIVVWTMALTGEQGRVSGNRG